MLIHVHKEITAEALRTLVSPRALEIIMAGNCKQDSLRAQLGHDEYHFDNNAIEKGSRYINEQRGLIMASLLSAGAISAWIAFGRLTHAVQDFYAHTNYVPLWLDAHTQNDTRPAPPEIDPLEKSLIESAQLRSGKVYLPMDMLYFVPFLRKLSLALLPRDSHGWMNLDSPEQGSLFNYARVAAVKRTQYEFELLRKILTPEMFAKFTDL